MLDYHQNIRPSCAAIMAQAQHVRIDTTALAALAERLSRDTGADSLPTGWTQDDFDRHFFENSPRGVTWLLVLTALNFSFWADEGTEPWTVKDTHDTPLHGYWALAYALRRAMLRGVPLHDADFLANLTAEDLHDILDGDGVVPLFDLRLSVLRELGSVLQRDWQGEAVNLLNAARCSAVTLANLLANHFPSFRDIVTGDATQTVFLKRAQIFIADLYGAFGGNGYGEFHDLDALTIFADYRLPQELRDMGILVYDDVLSHLVDSRIELPAGSNGEVEIRAATIIACDRLVEYLKAKDTGTNALRLDWYLWRLHADSPYQHSAHHRVRSCFY